MRQKTLLTALLLLTVALAGCTAPLVGSNNQQSNDDNNQQVTATQNDGLTITFESASNEYYEGDTARFRAILQNTGEAQANIQSLELFGASWASGKSVQNCGGSSCTLSGAEPANNIAGQSSVYSKTISLSGLALSQGQSDEYTVGLLTKYEYSTRARSSITLMSQSTYRENRNSRTQMSNTVTAGPVQVSFQGRTPYPDRNSNISIPFRISDVGDGHLAENKEGTPYVSSVKVKVEGQPITLFSDDTVQIYEGSRTLYATLDTSVLQASPQSTFTLVADVNYTYVEQDQTTVTVRGN